MQPTPLVAVHGTVLAVRHVTIPPRAASETAKAYDGGQYEEATVSTLDCALGGEEVDGLSAYLAVRFDSDSPALQHLVPGQALSMLCAPFVDLYKVRGRWANSVGYRFSRFVTSRHPVAV